MRDRLPPLTPVAWGLLDAFGATGLSFGGFLVFKAAYCGLLAFAVTRWLILRQVAEERLSLAPRR